MEFIKTWLNVLGILEFAKPHFSLDKWKYELVRTTMQVESVSFATVWTTYTQHLNPYNQELVSEILSPLRQCLVAAGRGN